ncbi:MAG: hypothetical protein ABFE07_04755 [Armatimonadia bacterium]
MANTLALRMYYDPGTGLAWVVMDSGDEVHFQAAGAFNAGTSGAITVGEYNGGTHVVNSSNMELCTTAHPANLAYSTDTTHYKKDGGAETLMDSTHPATTDCLNVHATCSPNAEVTAATIFAYGDTEASAPSGVTVYACKQGAASPAWTNIGGSAAALDLGTSASAATHDRYVGLCVTPTSNGTKTATLKTSVTVV